MIVYKYTTPTSRPDEEIKTLAIDFAEGKCANLGTDDDMKAAGIEFCFEYRNKFVGGWALSCQFLNQTDWENLQKYHAEYLELKKKFVNS